MELTLEYGVFQVKGSKQDTIEAMITSYASPFNSSFKKLPSIYASEYLSARTWRDTMVGFGPVYRTTTTLPSMSLRWP